MFPEYEHLRMFGQGPGCHDEGVVGQRERLPVRPDRRHTASVKVDVDDLVKQRPRIFLVLVDVAERGRDEAVERIPVATW
jgi:hypothetical protein